MQTDVTIIGAGPTGLCLASALAKAGMRVVLLERQSREALELPQFDGREIALTHESMRLLKDWGVWSRIPEAEISDLRHAQVLDGVNPQGGMQVSAALRKKSQLGWLVPNYLIRQAAYEQMKDHPEIELLDQVTIKAVRSDSKMAEVELSDGQIIRSTLLVAADSRFSETRRAMGISTQMFDYGKSMMVFRVEHEVAHEHVAWEWFGYGQTRALLPMNGQVASVVLTLPHEQLKALEALDEAAFNQDISQRYEFRLGQMKRISERFTYPLVGTYASRFHAQRFALIGDAAVGMHPVTAHGFNLGVLSIKHLSEGVIAAWGRGHDIGSEQMLSSYTDAHRRQSLPLYAATNLVVGLYTKDHQPARLLRKAVLGAAECITPFKRFVASQLTG